MNDWADLVDVPLNACRLFLRHWPALLTVIALALAGRQAFIWAAVRTSDVNSLLATLLIPFAPMCVMVGLIVMLWILRPSLPFLSTATGSRKENIRATMLTIGGLLIPFLTVYASNGLLKEDIRAFIYDATLDETMNAFFTIDYSRVLITEGWRLAVFVIVAIVLRKLIGFFALGERGIGFASLSAYLEILWMTTISVIIASRIEQLTEWITTREVIAPAAIAAAELKADLIDRFYYLGVIYQGAVMLVTKLDDLILVPVAWLTLGATIFGTSLAAKAKAAKEAKEHEAAIAAAESEGMPPAASEAEPYVAKSWLRTQGKAVAEMSAYEARQMLDNAAQPIWGPIKLTWNALKNIARAGLIPMLIFCIVFFFARVSELGVVWIGHELIGPRESIETAGLQPFVSAVARAVYFLISMTLLAAALDRILRFTHAVTDSEVEAAQAAAAEAEAAQAEVVKA